MKASEFIASLIKGIIQKGDLQVCLRSLDGKIVMLIETENLDVVDGCFAIDMPNQKINGNCCIYDPVSNEYFGGSQWKPVKPVKQKKDAFVFGSEDTANEKLKTLKYWKNAKIIPWNAS